MNVHENSMHTLLPEFFQDLDYNPFFESTLSVSSPENIFSILEALDEFSTSQLNSIPPLDDKISLCHQEGDIQQQQTTGTNLISQDSTFSFNANPSEDLSDTELEAVDLHKTKKQKLPATRDEGAASIDGQQKISHINVERNRRKQMNENLSILRSLMPCFYVKRGDQASIVGGVVDYITELQQVLQSLQAKKQRKVYSEVVSPRNLAISPRKPTLSPRLIPSLPVSPRTPTSPYKHHGLLQLAPYNFSPSIMSPSNSSLSSSIDRQNAVAAATSQLVANSKSGIADVEVKFSGPHVLVKTVSARIPGQALEIILALEDLPLQILHVSLSTANDAMILSFTIKIGIECQLSAEDLALHVQQTFC